MNKSLSHIDNTLLKLDEAELMALNRKIIERLKLIRRTKNVFSIAKFNIMDRVYFTNNGEKITGTIVRLNQKTISIDADNGGQWRVAPDFLIKIIEQ